MGRFKTLPNCLTLLRISLLPFIVVLVVQEKFKPALYLFLLCAFTDFLDGYIARRSGSATGIGELFDPVADKLLTSLTLIALAYVRACDPYSVIVIVGREEAVTGMRAIAVMKGSTIPVSKGGKLKTLLTMLSVILLLSQRRTAGELLLIASAVVALLTGLFYFYTLLEILRGEAT
jgi:CDP-diacylglycerol--glycerol-3-phosphate 3-phosphatidyltransferase